VTVSSPSLLCPRSVSLESVFQEVLYRLVTDE
jgi:hypothetical protein